MNNRTARLITTLDCNRNCHYCCNTDKMLASAHKLTNLDDLCNYNEICITGGEPMLYPEKTFDIIEELSRPNRKIYLYTTLAVRRNWLYDLLLNKLNGIHYTLHYNATANDITAGLYNIEELSQKFPDKSFRLYIDPELNNFVTVNPSRWSRIESFPFKVGCPLPEHEDLFILV